MAFYTTKAAAKLRHHKQVVGTNDTTELLQSALLIVDRIYAPGVEFKKAGVIMLALQPEDSLQTSLFDTKDRTKSKQLMEVIDTIQDLRKGDLKP